MRPPWSDPMAGRKGGRAIITGVFSLILRVLLKPFSLLFKASARSVSQPLPEKISVLLREAMWLLLGAVGAYLAMILYGYDKADPGWSHAVEAGRVVNPGGRFGAWVADMLLQLFGSSAWWLVALMFWGLFIGLRRFRDELESDHRSLLIVLLGFVIVLLTSCGLEAIRFHTSQAMLPGAPGGLVGMEFGSLAVRYLGFTGGTLLLIAAWAGGLSLFGGFSWLNAVEKLGYALERVWLLLLRARQAWQDRQAGKEVAVKREEKVKRERKKREDAPPVTIHIEPVMKTEPVRIVEARADKERQQPLFADLAPGAGLPALSLLDVPSTDVEPPSVESLEYTSRLIESKLADFGVEVKVLAAYPGPVITRYEIEPAVGVKGAQIMNLVKDLARALSVMSIRVVETIPGKACMGLEIPNPKRQTVRLSEIIGSRTYHDMQSPLTVALGKDIGGNPMVADLAKMPHLLVAGTTGSGKSVGINAMILSLLYKSEADKVRLILIDPKMLELSVYEGIPHLLAPVVTDMKHAAHALNWCVGEMERRYKLMSALGVRNLAGYNKQIADGLKSGSPIKNPFSLTPENPEPLEHLPMIVVVIDELADLMMVVGKKIEELIARLAQKARAAGVHLVLATQRPSVDVITGLIKANIPTRMAFQVSSKIDSRTILDQMGAESLLGMGDMLYLAPGTGFPTRVHGAFVDDKEVHKVVEYLKTTGQPDYVEGILTGASEEGGGEFSGDLFGEGGSGGESDELYDKAVAVVLQTRRPSISLVQRHLRIGYNRAARLIEQMEQAGLVSAANATGNREVLAPAREA
jgi:DNA segregation ATPase FtsK/SpoIIIE, S-DNA-T family